MGCFTFRYEMESRTVAVASNNLFLGIPQYCVYVMSSSVMGLNLRATILASILKFELSKVMGR
jgi:hypothetical protein